MAYLWVGKWLKSLRLGFLSCLLKYFIFMPVITLNIYSLHNCSLEVHRHGWTGQVTLLFDDHLEMLHYHCWCFYPWKLPCHICVYLPFPWTWKKPCTVEWYLYRILSVLSFPNHSQILWDEEGMIHSIAMDSKHHTEEQQSSLVREWLDR